MTPEQRKDIRREYLKEISFESMIAERDKNNVVCRNGHSADISHGGLGLVTSHKSIEGEILKLSVPFNDPDITLPVYAEVIWVKPHREYYKTGLRFLA